MVNRQLLSRDLDHAVLGKIELNSQMIAIYLQTLLKLIEELEVKIEEQKRKI